jgi:serine phosphatase RsbU (regulator of sigma subunit)
MKLKNPNILIDVILGSLIGFFILHPAAMLIEEDGFQMEIFSFIHLKHFLTNSMSLYFTLLGTVLGILSGVFRIRLRQKNQILKKQKDELVQANSEIDNQKQIVEKYNNYIIQSINCAKRIQTAMLAPIDEIQRHLPNSFVLLKPKDIVSGDFYWFSSCDNKIIIAAVDCTGHGVPGAILSMIANDLLSEIIIKLKTYSPDKILNKLYLLFRETLNQDKTENLDGVDISICVIKEKTIEFAGAKNSLVYIKNNEYFEIKGDNITIGGYNYKALPKFTKHIIKKEQNTWSLALAGRLRMV